MFLKLLKYAFITLIGLMTLIGGGVIVLLIVAATSLDRFSLPDMAEPLEESDHLILALDLTGPLREAPSAGPFAEGTTLTHMLRSLEEASSDPRVVGVMADLSGGGMGLAQAEELHEAILRFRSSGKPTIAYAESFGGFSGGTLPYLVASAFDEIHLQPSGDLAMTGLQISAPFFGDTFEKLGVDTDFGRRNEYKGAAEQFTSNRPSSAVEANINAAMDRFFDTLIRTVSSARGLEATAVSSLIDQAPLSAQEALDAGLITALTYPADIRKDTPHRLSAQPIPIGRYSPNEDRRAAFEDAPRIAVVPVVGPIQGGRGGPGGFGGPSDQVFGQDLADALLEAAESDEIDAVVLRIDSPGGSYVGSDAVWAALAKVRATDKPVIAWIGNIAGSGGYFIAMGADKLIATPGTLTGSIGVLAGKFVFEDALETVGINLHHYARGQNAGLMNPDQRFTFRQRRQLQATLDRVYVDFTGKAAASRGLSPEDMDRVAGGRVFSGSDALGNGLIDGVGGYLQMTAILRDALALPADAPLAFFPYPAPPGPLEALIDALKSGDFIKTLATLKTLGQVLTVAERTMQTPGTLSTPSLSVR